MVVPQYKELYNIACNANKKPVPNKDNADVASNMRTLKLLKVLKTTTKLGGATLARSNMKAGPLATAIKKTGNVAIEIGTGGDNHAEAKTKTEGMQKEVGEAPRYVNNECILMNNDYSNLITFVTC